MKNVPQKYDKIKTERKPNVSAETNQAPIRIPEIHLKIPRMYLFVLENIN